MVLAMRTELRLVLALCVLGVMASSSLFAGVVVVQSAVWEVNGHLYDLLASPPETAGLYGGLSWTDAESYAAAQGGSLATVDSAATQAWIWSQFGSANYHYWIGLEHVNGQYIWVGTGQPTTYSFWDWNEPNNYGGHEDYILVLQYGYVGRSYDGRWNDWQNLPTFGSPVYAVADMGVATPEPASLGMLAIGAALLTGLRRRA
jgi:hypothetical protein